MNTENSRPRIMKIEDAPVEVPESLVDAVALAEAAKKRVEVERAEHNRRVIAEYRLTRRKPK